VKTPWRLRDIGLGDIQKNRYQVAVLPFGATEPHNYHLPYGSDSLQVEAVAEKSCEGANQLGAKVILLPTIPYGSNRSTMAFPLTINLDHSTILSVVMNITDSLEAHKILKLVLLNGHGGNYLKFILKDLYGRTSVFVSLINWWEVGAAIRPKLFKKKGEHGDEMETSVLLYLYPDLVDMKKAGKGLARKTRFSGVNEGWVKIARPWELETQDSGHGDPSHASAEKGKKYVDYAVRKISHYLVELSHSPISKTFPY
jgi:creatinine amidohydrolase